MSRRTPIIAIAVLAVGAGAAMAATSPSAFADANPVDGPDTFAAGLWEITEESLPAVVTQKNTEFKTGDLKDGKVVPMQDFRVGPFYGREGGPHTGGTHSGLDMGADMGEPIYAASDGKVVAATWQGAAGKAVTIKTDSGKYVLYGHMSSIAAKEGQKVKAGDKIGRVGSTGNSTGPHLHLQVNRPSGTTMDPLVWLDTNAKTLIKEGRD